MLRRRVGEELGRRGIQQEEIQHLSEEAFAASRFYSSRYLTFQERYATDPIAFARDCILWPSGKGLAPYQEEALGAIATQQRVSVRGPHGLGKTTLAAIAVLWFSLTRDGRDWKVITTASAWRQLEKFLWPEIHKWTRQLQWDKIGRDSLIETGELLQLTIRGQTGSAFAVASDVPGLIEGAHADHLFYVFDESKSIPGAIFDAAEGAFSNAGKDTGHEALALSISTPGEPAGRFYEIQARKPGFEDWWVRHVTLEETIAANRVSQDWAEQRKRQWGEESAVYRNRVRGEFAASEEDSVIPLSWVEAANARWMARQDQLPTFPLMRIGADIARSGADKTVFALRSRSAIIELRRYARQDTMATTGLLAGLLRKFPRCKAIVDVIGIGAGVVDKLREDHLLVIAFNASEHTSQLDRSQELGFLNKRSAAWWQMRELLDPANGEEIALPPDDLLIGDLTTPHYKVVSGGKYQIESKDDIKKRIGRSTDDGDAVVMAFYSDAYDQPSVAPIVDEFKRPSAWRL
jgi:hypothetical protein